MISSDGITRDISAEDAVPWQPRPLDELSAAAPTLEERLQAAKQEGYQQGYNEAVAESEKIQSAQNDRITELLRYLGQPLASVDETLKQSLLSLAAEMASRIVAREIGNDLDYYRTQLDQLSDTLPAQVKVTSLRLRPEKARELRQIRKAATDVEEALPEVVDDAELAGDVCLACWQDSAVDISLRGRLAAIVQSYCGDNTTEALAIQVNVDDTEAAAVPAPGESDSAKLVQTEPVQTEPVQTELVQTELVQKEQQQTDQEPQTADDSLADSAGVSAELPASSDSESDAESESESGADSADVASPDLIENDTVSTRHQ
jgi:flagellar biosynthesis/type III secretory pathway protein FliH